MSAHRVETLIGISDDPRQIAIRGLVEDRLKLLLGDAEEIPYQLEYIVDEVSIARFNQLGSEGVSSHSVEGESMSWNDDLFAPYMSDIQAYRDSQNISGPGRVKFY